MVRLSFTGSRGSVTVPLADIAWVEGVRNYTRLQLRARLPGMVRRTMAEWEAILPTTAFGRISRSLIIQLAAIRSTQWQSRDQTLVFFHGVEAPLPLGRAGTTRLKDLVRR
ncbi:MAG: LytTR family DNA-binding domain-containing protein [Pirellulales bacterium]